jgi:hypothetical protein
MIFARTPPIEIVFALERDVGLAEIGVLEEFGVQRGAAGEHLGEPQAGLGDVLQLVGRADQPGGIWKGLGAKIVLGVNVRRHEIDRLRAGESSRDLVHGGAVARPEPGVDH